MILIVSASFERTICSRCQLTELELDMKAAVNPAGVEILLKAAVVKSDEDGAASQRDEKPLQLNTKRKKEKKKGGRTTDLFKEKPLLIFLPCGSNFISYVPPYSNSGAGEWSPLRPQQRITFCMNVVDLWLTY